MKNARLFCVMLLACSALVSCSTGGGAADSRVEHVVLLWQKRPGNTEDRAKIVASAKGFQKQIPGIQRLSVGTALPSERPVVDDSFDVGLVMTFANAADLAAYEKHPVHQEAVKNTLKPLAKKLLVYDIVTK